GHAGRDDQRAGNDDQRERPGGRQMDTWGISGSLFLVLYLAQFGAILLVVTLVRRRVLAVPDGQPAVPPRIDAYQAAYLSGGGSLVATTAISNLLRGGYVDNAARRGRWVRLGARSAPPAGAHPVEWAAYQVVAANPGRTLGDVRAALALEPAMDALRERLRHGGLVPSPEQRARYRATALWFVPLLALGAARVAAGSANGRPVGFLVALLVATVVVMAVLALRVPRATELGRRTLGRLRGETRKPTVGASPAELGMATALFGAGVLWAADTETAQAMGIRREDGAFLGGIGGGGDGGGGGGCGGGCGG
ncbi:MAG TPA: TIGR04222 domain-containing membrane protein, partial [Actinomycetes bacterium]|nr:TIGR04222 domain-containing membrane protein [Actinomycetes bacterium]